MEGLTSHCWPSSLDQQVSLSLVHVIVQELSGGTRAEWLGKKAAKSGKYPIHLSQQLVLGAGH
jgi:hypothetical protein